mgnify:CR=1 FL=1
MAPDAESYIFLDNSSWKVQGKADVHVHTMYSGVHKMGFLRFPESVADPRDVVIRAKEAGLNVVCITDHNTTAGALKAVEAAKEIGGIEVVVGEEISTKDGELLALFISEEIPAGLSVEETIVRVRKQGGLTIAPHPFSLHCPALGAKLCELDLDGIEVLNGGHIDSYANAEAERMASSGCWARLGGSDSHYLKTIGMTYTNFNGTTAADLRRSIEEKTTSAGGVVIPMDKAIAWSVGVVLRSDVLMLRSLLHLDKGETDDPIRLKVRSMWTSQKFLALVGSIIYLTPPIPFLVGMTSKRLLRKRAADELSNGRNIGPAWP